MATFSYTGRDRVEQRVEGTLEAGSRKDALRMLAARGVVPVSLVEGKSKGQKAGGKKDAGAKAGISFFKREKKVTRKHRLPFLVAVSELMKGGLSAGEALRLLSGRMTDPELKILCSGIWERIGEGATFSRALEAFPEVFDESTVNLIQAGEATGNVRDVLERLIKHLTERKEMQWQFIAALAYPVFLTVVAGLVVLFFLVFLLPRMEVLFTALRGELPTSTKLLIGCSHFAMDYGIMVVIALVVLVGSLWRWYKTEKGREAIDAALLKLPLAGPFCVSQTIFAFSQTLSILLENGITMAEALKMTERQISNRTHRALFSEATSRVMEGEPLSRALGRTGAFAELVLDQLTLGENTGDLVPSLKRMAEAYQGKLSRELGVFTKVIGTGVLLMVFSFVAFIAFSIISAVFQLSSAIQM